jgi:hypothetical protein
MLWASRNTSDPWVEIVIGQEGKPGEDVVIDLNSLKNAYRRLRAGERPPRLPSEAKGGGDD